MLKLRRSKQLVITPIGGLGNQLFIFFSGMSIADQLKKELVIDLSNAKQPSLLELLKNPLDFEYQNIQKRHSQQKLVTKIYRKIIRSLPLSKRYYVLVTSGRYIAKDIGYDGNAWKRNNLRVLDGYFQSCLYFNDFDLNRMRDQLSLKSKLSSNQGLVDKFATENPIVLHVRRGDYLAPENRFFGVLDSKYYINAINTISQNKPENIWIFSDDSDSAKALLEDQLHKNGHNLTFIDATYGLSTIDEFCIMSMGQKFVIANSTFSWWAAYLAGRGALVIYPSKWFELREDPTRMHPDYWTSSESYWKPNTLRM